MKFTSQLQTILFLLIPILSTAQTSEQELQGLLDSVYHANQEALGVLIHVEHPDEKLSWTAAVGFSDSSKIEALRATQSVLLASNTKTYVAAAIVRLAEEAKLKLDQPIKKLISKKTRRLFKKDGYALDQITVRHLLSHTSGIHDYVDEGYFQMLKENKKYQWSRDEQIQRAIDIGQPLAQPGAAFKYGDINYLLLTEIIETKTKKAFYTAIGELLKYEALGLSETWFVELEPAPKQADAFAHQYAENYSLDSYEINPTWDLFGGGGMAASVKDAALFYQYLFDGKIIQDKALLKEMHTYVLPKEQSKYCLGMYHFDFGYQLYYHGGWWGTDVSYSPDTQATVAVFTLVKEKRTDVNPFLGKSIHQRILQGL